MRCEGRDDDAPLRLRDDRAQSLAHLGLGGCEGFARGICGVAHHEVDPFLTEAREGVEIGVNAVDGRLVELEVAGMQNVSAGRPEEQAQSAWNGVVYRESLELKASELHHLARLDLAELRVLDLVLFELALDKPKGQLSGVNGHLNVQIFKEIRQGAGMVFVAMGNHDAAQFMRVLEQIGVVGQDQIDAGMIVVGKHNARIIEDDVVAALENGHVLADSIKAAQGNDLQSLLTLAGTTCSRTGALLGALLILAGALAVVAVARQMGTLAINVHMLHALGATRRRSVARAVFLFRALALLGPASLLVLFSG